ncbi:MAG: hypothetical protein WDZ59_05135 [Pirellulales bacterium]
MTLLRPAFAMAALVAAALMVGCEMESDDDIDVVDPDDPAVIMTDDPDHTEPDVIVDPDVTVEEPDQTTTDIDLFEPADPPAEPEGGAGAGADVEVDAGGEIGGEAVEEEPGTELPDSEQQPE